MKVLVYERGGKLVELDELPGQTLMDAIRDAGLNLTGLCGGCMACGTCHVYVDDAWQARVEPAGETENAMLDVVEERRENSRLSCQIKLNENLDGLTVKIAPDAGFD